MKKILILILPVMIFMTEAAYAASVKIGVIDTGVTQKKRNVSLTEGTMFLKTAAQMIRSDTERESQA